jgi:predicted RNA-binding protein YlxR (DUF448 family)
MAQPNWFRICVGCGQAKHKKELLRIVKCPGNLLAIDLEQKKPGRGAYICRKMECVKLAKKKRGFNRSFGMEVEQKFYDQLYSALGSN